LLPYFNVHVATSGFSENEIKIPSHLRIRIRGRKDYNLKTTVP